MGLEAMGRTNPWEPMMVRVLPSPKSTGVRRSPGPGSFWEGPGFGLRAGAFLTPDPAGAQTMTSVR